MKIIYYYTVANHISLQPVVHHLLLTDSQVCQQVSTVVDNCVAGNGGHSKERQY